MEFSDQELIEETRAGSTRAFEELMGRYERLVYRIGFAHTGDADDALDVTQNVFIKTYERLGSFRGAGSFKGWLMRIAHNESLNWVRKYARHRQYDELTSGNAPPCDAAQESQMVQSEDRGRLMNALLHLNPRQRQAVMLRYFEKMPIREISSLLDCSEATTKNLLFRSLQKLRSRLAPQWRES